MTSTEEFLKKFHSLQGITLAEGKKQLFFLLNSVTTPTEIDFTKLTPKRPLEEVFKTEALIFFRRTPELLEVLQSEHTVLIQKVLNVSSWFVPEAFSSLSGKALVDSIFPNLSYNTKLKLLNKLSQYLRTEKCEEFFQHVNNKYGLFLASKLLHSCSGVFILSNLKTYKIEVTPNQLLSLVKKNPEITEEVFEILDGYDYKLPVQEKYKNVFLYLAGHDDVFFKLYEKHVPQIRLGSRKSKTFLQKHSQLIITNPKKVYAIIKTSQIRRYLKADYAEFFCKVLPKTLDEFKDDINTYLSLLSYFSTPEEKSEFLSRCFTAVYGDDLLLQEDLFDENLLKLVPLDLREKLMEVHSRPDSISENTWISFMKVEKSFPLLKKKFQADVHQREDIIRALLQTCQYNDSLDALLDLIKYFLDNPKYLTDDLWNKFLDGMSNCFKLKRLKQEHWACLGKCLDFIVMDDHYTIWQISDIFVGYIDYCCTNQLPIDDLLVNLIRVRYMSMWYTPFTIVENEKRCLLLLPSLLPRLFQDRSEMKRFCVEYLTTISTWNKKHKDHKISCFDHEGYIEDVKSCFLDERINYTTSLFFSNCIVDEFEKSKQFGLFEMFCQKPSDLDLTLVLTFLIKNHPSEMKKFFKPLTKQKYINFALHFYKYFDNLNLPQEVTNKCLEIIKADEEDGDARTTAATILVHTMSHRDLSEFISSFQPDDSTIKLESESDKNVYKTQKGFLSCLNQINPPSLATELILEFCQGDYFKLVNKALFSTAQMLKEENAEKLLRELYRRPVSVKKHSIMLRSRIFDKQNVRNTLVELTGKEKNSTIRKSLLKASFNLFCKNQEDWAWELVKENVNQIALNDSEALNILAQYEKVSPRYFAEYFIFTWNVLESAKQEEIITVMKCRFLNAITEKNIKLLPLEFCYTILERYLFKPYKFKKFEDQIQVLAARCLIYHTSTSTARQRVGQLVPLLKTFLQTWYDAKTASYSRKYAYNFIKELCTNCLQKKSFDENEEVIARFSAAWGDLLEPYQAYDHYLYLKLTLLYLNCSKLKWSQAELGENLATFLSNEQNLDMNTFCKIFEGFKQHFGSIYEDRDANESYLMMAESVLKLGNQFYLLVLVLLPKKENLLTLKVKQNAGEIFSKFLNSETEVLQAELLYYFNANSYEDVQNGWND